MTKNIYYSILLFLFFIFIYYIGSFNRIPFGDCVGFVLLVEKGDFMNTATAMNHFLYINTAIIFKNITHLNAIEANRLLVILSAAATVVIVYLTIKILVNKNWIAIVTSFVFGFSYSFWKNAEIIEVYSYNSLWISLFFFCMIKSFQSKKQAHIILSGVFVGISLWLHIQNILLVPAFLLFLFYFKYEKKTVYLSLVFFIGLFASLFILNYFQGLPFNSPYSSEQKDWVKDSLKKTTAQYVLDLGKSVIYLFYNFNLFTFFGFTGMILLYQSKRKMFFVFFTASLCVYGFSTFYAVSDNYVFFIPFNIIFALSVGYGLSAAKYSFMKKISWVCLLIPAMYYFIFKTVLLTEKGKEFNNFKNYKGGLEYYMLPWMSNNVGIVEFTINKKTAPEQINWMTVSAEEYIHLLKSKGYTNEQIRNF